MLKEGDLFLTKGVILTITVNNAVNNAVNSGGNSWPAMNLNDNIGVVCACWCGSVIAIAIAR